MTNHALDVRGGSESYLETVAPELRRLGHDVSFFSPGIGPVATSLRGAGFEVYEAVADLPRDVDVIHGQHADVVGMVRARLPRVPLVVAVHSWFIPLEDPVPELGAAAFVCFNDLTRRRLEAHAASSGTDVIRLTQPVEVSFADGARAPIAAVPRRAVAVSRRMSSVPARLATVCAELDLDFDWVGGPGHESADPREEMRRADIVFGVGRTALEAMAAGRAVFLVDESVTGGWMTPASYPSFEADGFTGLRTDPPEVELAELLSRYTPELGADARRLVVRHHVAQDHAARLVEVYSAVADASVAVQHPQTVALLVGDRHTLEQRAVRAEWQATLLRRELDDLRRLHEELARDLERVVAWRDRVRGQRDRARRQRDLFRQQRDAARERSTERQPSLRGRLRRLLHRTRP